MKIEFFKHSLEEIDIKTAQNVMRSIFLTTGPAVREFEQRFAAYLGMPQAIGLTSCTGAIHLALLRSKVGPGDEVITTPMTFVATITAILEAGATPVLVDVSPASGLLLPGAVEKAITKKTKALLPVHLYGRMADMRGFARLAKKYKLALIEDAAHCIEGERDGVRPGHLSKAACFSFYATKSLTCGEGGALVCRDREDADWYRSARHHGISRNAVYRYTKRYEHWDMEMMGWKYNMADIEAALLLHQIDRLDSQRQRREELELLYRKNLSTIEELDFLEPPVAGEISGHHLFTVLLPRKVKRDEVMYKLQQQGIGCAVNYRAVHNLTYLRKKYGYQPVDFPVANEMGERTVSLPLYPKLTARNVLFVCRTLKKILTGNGR